MNFTGYLLSTSDKRLKELNNKTQLIWFNRNVESNQTKPINIYWAQTKALLNANCIVIDLAEIDLDVAYQISMGWTLNYMRQINHKNNFREINVLLDKFHFPNKTMIVIDNKRKLSKYLRGSIINDHAKIVKNWSQVIKLINKLFITNS